jgi:hypothetical protein
MISSIVYVYLLDTHIITTTKILTGLSVGSALQHIFSNSASVGSHSFGIVGVYAESLILAPIISWSSFSCGSFRDTISHTVSDEHMSAKVTVNKLFLPNIP